MGYGTICIVVILQFILHGCGESVLSRNFNNIFVKFFVADGPISCLEPSALRQRCGQLLFQVVHRIDVLGVQYDSNSEWFHIVIVNIFDIFPEVSPILFPHALP